MERDNIHPAGSDLFEWADDYNKMILTPTPHYKKQTKTYEDYCQMNFDPLQPQEVLPDDIETEPNLASVI